MKPSAPLIERPATIQTDRLALVALLPAEIEALISGDVERASLLIGFTFPRGWPDDPDARSGLSWHLQALNADHQQVSWRIRVIVELASNRVVGSINLKGPPDADGDVEIGWGVVADYQRRGYAYEAAAAVIAWLHRQPGVRSISATVPSDNSPSQHLATKLGLFQRGVSRRGLPLWSNA